MVPELLHVTHELIWFSGGCLVEFSKLDEIRYTKGNPIIGGTYGTPTYIKNINRYGF